MTYLSVKDNAITELSGELLSTEETSFDVVDGSRLSETNFVVTIGNEKILITSRTGNTLTVGERGYEDTTPATHADGSYVRQNAIAGHIKELQDGKAEITHAPEHEEGGDDELDIDDLADAGDLKTTWSGKQDNLGYTPENSANKKTELTDSDTDYPTTKAVNTGLAGKQDTGDYALEPEVTTVASSATPTPTGGSKENEYYLTALEDDATFGAPSGTPANGNTLLIRITDDDDEGDYTLTWNEIYEDDYGTELPEATVAGKTVYLGFIYNGTKWILLSKVEEE